MKVSTGRLTATLLPATMAMLLTACGGSSNKTPEEEIITEGEIYGPYSTGSTSEPVTVYFDLDTQSTVELTDEEAATDTTWDIAFRRTKVWLNTAQETPVSVYFTGNNADFYDADGNPIADMFTTATADSELDDYTAITLADVPEADAFSSDEAAAVVGTSFYNYDMTTHVVTAADDVYYIVYSDSNYTKFRVTDIQTTGREIGEITFEIAHQSVLDGQSEFATAQTLTLQTEACTDDTYVDFDTQTTATEAD
ncbi:MAG: hypothetical protein GY923_13790, partial [Aestuariibacter sp.]|nr:hypothetical protein [Aestuariibacter sp.]